MIIIGDVHGCYKTLLALLDKLPDDEICFVGDLIDRGPSSKQVVDLVIENKWKCVMGNHEQMMIDYWNAPEDLRYLNRIWLSNGGLQTKRSYTIDGVFDMDSFGSHAEWMKQLPIVVERADLVNEAGRHLIVSHSHISNVWGMQYGDERERQRFVNDALWGRGVTLTVKRNKDIYNVIGHTPQPKVRIKSFYANVDTGCYWKHNRNHVSTHKKGMFHLTALQFPQMNVYTQDCIDEVDW